MARSAELDAIDRSILRLLQRDASLSLAAIAEEVGLTQTPCWKRIRRMEQAGILTRRVALVDPAKVGLPLTAFVAIETGDHSGPWLERFAGVLAGMPEVMDAWRMAGDIDYLLRVVVPDMTAYDVFYRRLIAAIPLKNVSSRFAMEHIKAETVLPVPE
ncbi:MAG: transcriptional regulator [Alphaproteobacteria bacterium]|nr:MAG: transcriptional regulator [Alphaproteobacteria bacterium]